MFYIGLDIGGTKCAASLGYICDEDIKICDKDYFSTADKSPYKILQRFSLFIKKHLSKDIQGIGISCGDLRTGGCRPCVGDVRRPDVIFQ